MKDNYKKPKDRTTYYLVVFLLFLVGVSFISGQLNKENLKIGYDKINNIKSVDIANEFQKNISEAPFQFIDQLNELTKQK
jgi:hypothetical protein